MSNKYETTMPIFIDKGDPPPTCYRCSATMFLMIKFTCEERANDIVPTIFWRCPECRLVERADTQRWVFR